MKSSSPTAKADAAFSRIIRSRGNCEACGTPHNLQCAHGFSRRYRNTRWHHDNAFALCRGCHTYYTHRPIEWDDWLVKAWGEKLYGEMRALALSTEKVDPKAVLKSLQVEEGAL